MSLRCGKVKKIIIKNYNKNIYRCTAINSKNKFSINYKQIQIIIFYELIQSLYISYFIFPNKRCSITVITTTITTTTVFIVIFIHRHTQMLHCIKVVPPKINIVKITDSYVMYFNSDLNLVPYHVDA